MTRATTSGRRRSRFPPGDYEYKAALNDSWTENYGLNAQSNGPNIPVSLPAAGAVKFYYDHESHWATDNKSSVIAVAPGSFQSELGCPGDWDPTCLRSWLQDPDGDGIYTFETTALPAGSYETKVAIDEDWAENYGQGGVLNGSNIPFNVPVDNTKATFSYNAVSHVLTVTVATPAGAPGWPGALSHFDLARKDCLGTARNTTSKVWYTVANGVLSDVYYPTIDNTNVETLQYVVTDGSTFTDLQTRDMTYAVEAIPETRRHGLPGHRDGEERQVQDRDRLPDGSRPEHGADAAQARSEAARLPALRALRPDRERQRRRRRGQRRRGLGGDRRFDRAACARRLRPDHGDERGEPRLRAAGPRGARRHADRGDERLRRLRERRSRSARCLPRPDPRRRRSGGRKRRPDGARGGRAGRPGHPRARLRSLPGRSGRDCRGLAQPAVRRCVRRVQAGLEEL